MANESCLHEGGQLLCAVSLSVDVNKNTQILKREVLRSLRLFDYCEVDLYSDFTML